MAFFASASVSAGELVIGQSMESTIRIASPGGATQISPALQRWEQRQTDKVPEGRPNSRPEA
jgi:hypothetical protein